MATSLIAVSCAFLTATFAAASAINCPQKCICQQPDDKTLTVNCAGGQQVNESILSHELDLLLSEDDLAERLTTVKITNTPLTHLPKSVCRLANLTSLNLDFNRLARLPDNCFTGIKALQSLSARNNRITVLQDGLFDGLDSLRELHFNSNRIDSIGLRVFSNPNDLVNLRRVELDYNRLRSLEPWPYIRGLRGSADSKVEVSFYENLISEFTNNIGWRINCSCRSYADVMLGNNYIRHIGDIPAGWNITSLAEWTCVKHCKYKGSAFQVDSSWSHDYQCDCRDVDFYHSVFIDHSVFRFLPCRDPLPLRQKYVIQIPLEEFACDWPDGCPSGCRCAYRPANATFHVYCSATNLPSLPLRLPPLPKSYDRYKLDFSKNKFLRRLEYRSYFAGAFLLDVSNCAIDVVDLDAWRAFAKLQSPFLTYAQVDLRANNLETIPFEVTGINFSSVQLALNQNPWQCSCGNKWMIGWLKSLSFVILNGGDVMCASPPRLAGKSIVRSSEEEFCVNPATRMLEISLSSTLSSVAVLLLFGFGVYRLRVRLYRRWKFHPFDRDECVGEDMDYDVFLCCSSEDHNPHGLRLLEQIESNGYRVCYHLRDFLAGVPITDNMMQSVVRSKRTVCLISMNFLQSSFCMTEFDMAYHHNVAVKRKKRLVALMMLDRPTDLYDNDASDTATLRQFLRQYTYINYTADDWLDKLLYALPLHGLLQNIQNVGNRDDDPLH